MTVRDSRLIQAIEWLSRAREAPKEYWDLATALIDSADADADAVAVAHAVRARCALERLDARVAVVESRSALALARSDLDDRWRAELTVVHASALTASGRLDEALRALSAGAEELGPAAAGLLEIERCHLHYRRGEIGAAFDAVDRALSSLPDEWRSERARAFNNRGVTRLYLGGARAGLDDLRQAERLFEELGRPLDAADSAHNRGMMLARLGDLPGALATFDRAERAMAAMGVPIDIQLVARAEVMVLAGLVDDVAELMPEVVERLEREGMASDAAEGRLYLAMARLGSGDRRAIDDAIRSAAEFRASEREGWALLGDDLQVQAELRFGQPGHAVVEQAWAVAERLDAAGMRGFATASWLRAAMAAESAGDRSRAVTALAIVADRRGTLSERVLACEAAGRRHLLDDDPRRASGSFERGLRLIERNRSLFEATELRVEASAWGERLAGLLVDLAWDDGDVDRLLTAAERWRATALATRPPLPPPDHELSDLLADFRAAHAGAELALRDESSTDDATSRLRRAEAAVGHALRRRSPVTAPTERNRLDVAETVSASVAEVAGCALVEFVESRGRLGAIVVTASSRMFVDLGSGAVAAGLAEGAHRSLRQLAPAIGHPASRLLVRSATGQLAGLRSLLADPLGAGLERATEIVVVPVGGLHLVPWSVVFGRPVAVSPSAAVWSAAASSTIASTSADRTVARSDEGTLVVAGPRLDGAVREARSIGALHTGSTLLEGAAATASHFLRGADGARLVHVACHSRFRADNPLFSTLELADGPVTGFELERLQRAPGAMVLSACSTGRVSARAGGELLGLATMLLAAGTSALVTSMLPLPDERAVPALESVHRALIDGSTIGDAVFGLTSDVDPTDPGDLVLASALTCYGRGDWRLTPAT